MAQATNSLPADNPFAAASTLPYTTPAFDTIRDEHFLPAFEAGMQQHLAEVRAIAANAERPTFANTIVAMEQDGELLDRVSSVFFNLTGTDTTKRLQEIQAEVAPKLAAHSDAIWLDKELFARVKAVYDARDTLTGPEQQRLAERYYTTFVRHGAQLSADKQQRLREINELSSKLTTKFQERLLADTKDLAVVVDDAAQLEGLGASGISAAQQAAEARGLTGKYLLTLQLPSSQGILSSLDVRATRQRVYEASIARCNRGNDHDTKELVLQLAALRAEKAALLGFATHAHYVLDDETAGTPEAVERMLASMTPAIVAKAKGEAAELQAWLDENQPGTKLAPWDWSWVAERVRRARYDLDESAVKQFFEMERVLQDGLFFMAQQLYGVTMKERHDLPVYHPDVRVFEVFDGDGSTIGLFYADYYTRDSKRGGAWMSNFVEQSELLHQKPVVINVMNIQKPSEGQPTLLSFDEVTTMFHEFGHGVHGLFSRVHYPLLAGTNVPRDFVEFPSQFHEDFAFDPAVLARCAKHHETGEAMPQELVGKIQRARKFGQGFASLEYIAAAWLDMAWHSLAPGTEVTDVAAFEQAALEKAGVAYELVPPRYKSTYFSHVWPGGYSAGYYAYLWSEALAADGFACVMEHGGMNADNGKAFRDAVLSRGLTGEPLQMFEAFRGRPLDTKALLRRRGLE
ncbi:MAG: M3 family metallopeptidase [Planctomycetota bacterium]